MQDFRDIIDGECFYVENFMTVRVMGKGKILLKFTSGKLLSLSNVLYVPSLPTNLVSGYFLTRLIKNCC